mmetsp:Transcript_4412/g.5820  ORF Transcript_4412/g.5820 Transcript_4412/m.5820 type:complete len:348 (+) Transcript_4412:144-1187(+)
MMKRPAEQEPQGTEGEHPSTRLRTEELYQDDDTDSTAPENTGNDAYLYAPQHKQIYGDSIFAACQAANATRTRRHKSDEEKRLERLAANRRSARESRNRKKVVFEELQRSVAKLADENGVLRTENQTLRKEMAELKRKYGVKDEDASSSGAHSDHFAGTGVTESIVHSNSEFSAVSAPVATPNQNSQITEDPFASTLLQQTPDMSEQNMTPLNYAIEAADLAGGHGVAGGVQNHQTFQPAVNVGDPSPTPKQDTFKLNYDQIAMIAAAQQQQQLAQAAQYQGIQSNLGRQDMSGDNNCAATAQFQQQQQQQTQHQQQQQNARTTEMLLELLQMQHAALKQQQAQRQE